LAGIPWPIAAGEFSGICAFSTAGTEKARAAYAAARARGDGARFHEAATFRRAALTDLIQDLVESGADVRGVLHWKGWMEVDTFEDYRRAWAEAHAG
jgi:phosphoenolpyruvate phosphomutase